MNIIVPIQLLYTSEHEWARVNESHTITIGITNYAQNSLGDIIFIELPEVGSSFKQGEIFGVVESVKAASDLYMPLSGTITKINAELVTNPELINQAPYNEGWMLQIQLSNDKDLDDLLSPNDYQTLIN